MNPQPHAVAHNAPPASRPAGLLVVTIDRLPAWILSPYGATWVGTPALDGLAARGIVFDRVITPSLEVRDTLQDLAMPAPAGRSLFEAAAAIGWRSALVTDDAAVAAGMAGKLAAAPGGTSRLVEAVAKPRVAEDDAQTNIARLVDATLAVVEAGTHRLVWCHVGSLGVSWDAPEHYRERYVDPEDPPPPSGAAVPGFPVAAETDPDLVVGMRHVFAGQLTLLDSQLGRLFAAIHPDGRATESRADGWAVLFIGARGLPLGLHGWMGVGGEELPYGESIHVPAILVDAAGRMAAQRYGRLVVPADCGATLVDLLTTASGADAGAAAINPKTPWRGVSLATLLDDWSAPERDRVIAAGPAGAAIVTPAWHGLLARGAAAAPQSGPGGRDAEPAHAGLFRLFAKPDDYFEQADVADRCGGIADGLAALTALALLGDRDRAWLDRLPGPDSGSHRADLSAG